MTKYKPSLMSALIAGDKREANIILRDFKTHGGATNYTALLSIPTAHRLPMLAKTNYREVLGVVTAGITMAIESMNLNRPMNSLQVVDLSDTILESAEEDNLSLEDVMLFLQGLVRGNYGPLYESMDIPKFMEKFEVYREERYKSLCDIRYEQEQQHKAAPVNPFFVSESTGDKEKGLHRDAMKDYLKHTEPPK